MSLLIKTSDNSYNIYVDEYINKNFYSYIDDLNKGQKFILCYPKNLKFHISKIISNLKSFGINILSHLFTAALAESERHSLLRIYLGKAYWQILHFLICCADQREKPTNGIVR